MIEVRVITPLEADAFCAFTFPIMRPMLTGEVDWHRVMVGAWDGDLPVGLALVAGNDELREFELMSLTVSPLMRFQGVARRLMDEAERIFTERGYRGGWHFPTVPAEDQGALRFLTKIGWTITRLRQLVCKVRLVRQPEIPMFNMKRPMTKYHMVPWHTLSENQRQAVHNRQDEEQWYPKLLDPFVSESDSVPELSLALLDCDNNVVGWLHCHKIDDMFNRVTNAFVAPELQRFGLLPRLVVEMLRHQTAETNLTQVVWTVPFDLMPMINFTRARLGPWLDYMGYACSAYKTLNSGASMPSISNHGRADGVMPSAATSF